MLKNLSWQARRVARDSGQLFKYGVAFLLALVQPRAVLAARLLAAESQLAMCKHRFEQKKDPRPEFNPGFRPLWVIFSNKTIGGHSEQVGG